MVMFGVCLHGLIFNEIVCNKSNLDNKSRIYCLKLKTEFDVPHKTSCVKLKGKFGHLNFQFTEIERCKTFFNYNLFTFTNDALALANCFINRLIFCNLLTENRDYTVLHYVCDAMV